MSMGVFFRKENETFYTNMLGAMHFFMFLVGFYNTMETALITTRYIPLSYTIPGSSKKNKLARHSISYKEESWKGVRLNWDT